MFTLLSATLCSYASYQNLKLLERRSNGIIVIESIKTL